MSADDLDGILAFLRAAERLKTVTRSGWTSTGQPESVAEQLGLDAGPDARTKRYQTANGVVEHPVVTLRSVSLGGARVENVPASVSPNMNVGLACHSSPHFGGAVLYSSQPL